MKKCQALWLPYLIFLVVGSPLALTAGTALMKFWKNRTYVEGFGVKPVKGNPIGYRFEPFADE